MMKNDCEATFVSDSVQDDTNEDDDNIDNIVKHKDEMERVQTQTYCVRHSYYKWIGSVTVLLLPRTQTGVTGQVSHDVR